MEIENSDLEIFKNYINRSEYDIKLEGNKVINIEKNKLSFYFNEICVHNESKKDFNFIIDNNRMEFIDKIDKFFGSQDKFYWILGSDGIGKTTTLLVYSSLIKSFRKLYLNLKLFSKKKMAEIESIFYDEIKRLFITDNNNDLEQHYEYYLQIISGINKKSKEIKEKYKNDWFFASILNGIGYFWLLLFYFLEIYNSLKIKNLPLDILLIIDQYKSINIDPEYQYLNRLVSQIDEIKDYKIKMLISCSINNYDIKHLFLENLYTILLEKNNYINKNTIPLFKKEYKEIKKKSNNSEQEFFQEDKELIEIGKYLDSIYEYNKKLFEKYLNKKINKNNYSQSQCSLNSKYSQITKKEYYNNFVTCKDIIDSNLGKNFRYCIRVFNYSLKYYERLLKEINKTNRNAQENDNEYEIRVLKLFYGKLFDKIEDKLKEFYSMKYNELNIENITFTKYFVEQLVELREAIFEEKIYKIDQISNILESYPTKYLNIYLCGLDKNYINIDNAELCNNFSFYFDYSNNFIRAAINRIINMRSVEYKNISLEGSGYGAEFEKRVNSALETLFYNISKRYIFALIGATKNTKNYIDNIREKEENFFYEFYNLKRLDIFIDGVDKYPITKDIFNIKGKNIFLSQVSKTAKSFDNALLYRIEEKDEEIYTHDLVNVQMTKSKPYECKSMEEYTKDCLKSKKYLQKVYKDLKIRKIYFIFILPYKCIGLDKTIKELKSENIYFMFYNSNKNIFCDDTGNIIYNLKIKEAEINNINLDFHYENALNNYNKSKIIINRAIKIYLSKERLYNNNFINCYIKISGEISYDPIKIIIPDQLKYNIKLQLCEKLYFKKDNHLLFLFTTNYKGTRIDDFHKNTLNLVIFSYNSKIYFNYGDYYEIKDDYSIEEVTNIKFEGIKKVKKPKYNTIDLFDIKKFPLFCFCYRIIRDYNFDIN